MNAIKLNLVDFEVVKELRKIDGKLIIFGLGIVFLLHDNFVRDYKIKKLEKRIDDLLYDKEKSKED